MKTLRLSGLLLAIGLLPFAASAAPTVNTLGGDTRVQLSADLTGALTSLGVSVKASYPARLRGAGATFPIPGGELDLGSLKGEIDHAGGLTLRAGKTEVNLSSYTIDTTGDAPVLTGLVKLNDSVLGRFTQFEPPTGVGMSPHPSEYGVSPMTAMPTAAPAVAEPSSAYITRPGATASSACRTVVPVVTEPRMLGLPIASRLFVKELLDTPAICTNVTRGPSRLNRSQPTRTTPSSARAAVASRTPATIAVPVKTRSSCRIGFCASHHLQVRHRQAKLAHATGLDKDLAGHISGLSFRRICNYP